MLLSTPPLAVLLAAGAGAMTVLGGVVALRLERHRQLLFALAGGVVIGVALFDLLPEALEGGAPALSVMFAVAAGFLLYLAVDRTTALADRGGRWPLGPASLVAHSFMDGLGIGVAFGVRPAVGWMVAVAVIAHDIFDGVNTVTLSLEADGGRGHARRWLVTDALAPVGGALLAQAIHLPAEAMALLLAVFAGFFLYIGSSELLPRSRLGGVRYATLPAPALGAAFVYTLVRLAPH